MVDFNFTLCQAASAFFLHFVDPSEGGCFVFGTAVFLIFHSNLRKHFTVEGSCKNYLCQIFVFFSLSIVFFTFSDQ